MGDWGYGPFDNDDAADWIYEVEASDGLGSVRTKLTQVLEVEGELESPDAHEGLAAAEILAIAIGPVPVPSQEPSRRGSRGSMSVPPTLISHWRSQS